MTLIISIAMIAILLLCAVVLIAKPMERLSGAMPTGVMTFAAILFTSGLDVGLIMFPLTEFPVYAEDAVYGFTNPLAMAFGAWGFLVWALYFLTTFYFCAIEPHIKFFEIPFVKWIYNLVVIATCSFTGFLFFKYLPDYITGLSQPMRYALVAGVILLAVISSTHTKYIKWLSVSSTGLFYALIVVMFVAGGLGLSGLGHNLVLMADYFPNMHRFTLPISDYHQFYLYWWMAWSIMIGQFVSRFLGRLNTLQLLAALLVLPSLSIALWFAVLYGFYDQGLEVSKTLKLAMVGVGILFVINSLDSLTRLYTDNLGLSAERFRKDKWGSIKYIVINWSLLFGLVLLYRHTELKIEWVGLIVIGIYAAAGFFLWCKRAALSKPAA